MIEPVYPWFAPVHGDELQQGDVLSTCEEPIILSTAGDEADVTVHSRVVVLSQSCDLENGKIAKVIVCPCFDFKEWLAGAGVKQADGFKRLKEGRYTHFSLIDACGLPGLEWPHLVTDFGGAFTIPIGYAQQLARSGPRVRILPPYREHLAQAFARFIMRIGLPLDVSEPPK